MNFTVERSSRVEYACLGENKTVFNKLNKINLFSINFSINSPQGGKKMSFTLVYLQHRKYLVTISVSFCVCANCYEKV